MPSNRPSLQDRIRQRQSGEFVGREDQLALFRRNFALPLDERIYVFNVFGQGGVGKTTLLRRFRETAVASGALPALTDHDQTDVLTAMEQLAADFGGQGHELRGFVERYRVYRQRRQELESEPDAPTGLSSLFARTLVKGGLALARGIPVGGGLVDLVDGDVAAAKTGEWVEYVARKLRNNTDEIRLVREPVAELTRLWLDDLNKIAEKSPVVLFFDTYERTAPFLDAWLCDVLGGTYGPLIDTTQIVIAGRDELDRNRWSEYESAIARISLEPFTDEEARDFLTRKGVTNQQVADVILKLSGRLPLLVATLAAERPDDPAKVGDPSGTAVERFLVWTEDPALRRAAVDAALPRQFNRDLVALLVEDTRVDHVFEWLRRMPFVEERGDGWVYHSVVRDQMLRYKRRESHDGWSALHERLAEYFEQRTGHFKPEDKERWRDPAWRAVTLEGLYHRLCQSPQRYLQLALNSFLECRDATNLDTTTLILDPIAAATGDSNESLLQSWSDHLRRLCAITPSSQSLAAVELWDTVAGHPQLTARNQAIAHTYRGLALREVGQYGNAIAAISRAINCDSQYSWAFAVRGAIYRILTRYDDALADLDQAIEIRPRFVWALTERAKVYRSLKRYDAALKDLSLALEVHPAYAPALARRGATYRVLKRYDDALANLSSALSYNSTNSWFLYQHALVCLLKGDRQTGDASLASAVSLARQSYTQNPDDLNEPLMLMLYLMASGNIADGRSLFEELITGVPLYALRTAADVFDDYLVSFPANADAQAIRAELQAEIERRQSEGSPDQT